MYVYLPFTVTKKVQVEYSPLPFPAMHTTSLFPIRNSDPDGGIHVTLRSFPLTSLTDGSFHTTIAVDSLGSVTTPRFAGQIGSGTFGIKKQKTKTNIFDQYVSIKHPKRYMYSFFIRTLLLMRLFIR